MIGAALLGLGNIAWKYDANKPDCGFSLTQGGALKRHPGVKLMGGCSPDAGDRQGFSSWSGGLPAFATPQEMLEQLRPEMVGICSPTQVHFEHACLCLEAGVRLLWLEKPPTANSEELRHLIRLAEQQQATVCVNYFRRYLPSYQQLRRMLQEQTMGPCQTLRITYSPGLARNGVHLLDQIFFVTNAQGYRLLWVEQDANPDCPSFALRLPDGQLVLGCGGTLPYHTNDISVQCMRGTLAISRGGKETSVAESRENEIFPGFFDLHTQSNNALGAGGVENCMQKGLKDLLVCGANGSQPQSNLYSALLSQQLLEDILTEAAV